MLVVDGPPGTHLKIFIIWRNCTTSKKKKTLTEWLSWMSKVTHLYYFLGLPLPRTTNQVASNNANLFSHSSVWRPEVWNEGFHQAGFCWSPQKNAVHASLAAAAGGGQSLRCLVCRRIVSPAPATCICAGTASCASLFPASSGLVPL